MDTVLGLSVTPTTAGWVLAEGHGADGTILDHHEFQLPGGAGVAGVRAVYTAEEVAAEVLRAKAVADTGDHRVRVIGVTWNDEASTEAALLLEALTDAGLDNVVPIRLLDAVETLAKAIAPVIGYQQTAVCILEHEWATVVMVDTHDGETQTAVKHVRGGFDGLTSWLTGMFDHSAWRPAGVVVVGSDHDINAFTWQLEKVLPVPVFAQTMAQVTVARGAALAAAQSTEFTDAGLVADAVQATPAPRHRRRLSYTGAVTALTAATVTFVTSLSLAVGLQLVPDKDPGKTDHVAPASPPQVAEAVAPPVAPAPLEVKPAATVAAPQPAPPGEQPARLTTDGTVIQPGAEPGTPDEQPSGVMPQQDPTNRSPQLTRVLEHIPGAYGDSAPPE